MAKLRFKASETLLGIEKDMGLGKTLCSLRFKASETLLGIEKETRGIITGLDDDSKPLKPF